MPRLIWWLHYKNLTQAIQPYHDIFLFKGPPHWKSRRSPLSASLKYTGLNNSQYGFFSIYLNNSELECSLGVVFFAAACSLFGFIVLQMIMYATNIYYWRWDRVNYLHIWVQARNRTWIQMLVGFSTLVSLHCFVILPILTCMQIPKRKTNKALTEPFHHILLIVSSKIRIWEFKTQNTIKTMA